MEFVKDSCIIQNVKTRKIVYILMILTKQEFAKIFKSVSVH